MRMDRKCSYHKFGLKQSTSNSYTMGCPPVRGDNPRALASGLSYAQVDEHGITVLYCSVNGLITTIHTDEYRSLW